MRRMTERVLQLETDALWRRISDQIEDESKPSWDERAKETLPLGIIEMWESEEPKGDLRPEKEIRPYLRCILSVPSFRQSLTRWEGGEPKEDEQTASVCPEDQSSYEVSHLNEAQVGMHQA